MQLSPLSQWLYAAQVTVEQQALEDYLLSQPSLKAAASQVLSARAAATDIVTLVLTQLTSKPPPELWSLIHADAATPGKSGKAAPAKTPAPAKGKAGMILPCSVLSTQTKDGVCKHLVSGTCTMAACPGNRLIDTLFQLLC